MSRFFAEQPSPSDPAMVSQSAQYPPVTEQPTVSVAPQAAADPPTTPFSNELNAAELDTRPLHGEAFPADAVRANDASAASPKPAASMAAEAAHPYELGAPPSTPPSTADSQAPPTHSRYDAITGRWTIFAVGRDQRPCDYTNTPPGEVTSFDCPFCSGNEHQTPAAVLEIDANDCDRLITGDADRLTAPEAAATPWVIRVIPNKYPAVDSFAEPSAQPPRAPQLGSRRDEPSSGLFLNRSVTGGHEVFIESPDHHQSILTLDLAQVTMLLRAYQARMLHWREVPSVRYLSLFKNVGPAAGASLHHSHSQLIATSELPVAAKTVADRMKFHWARTGCCLQCDTIRAEIKAKQRIVATTGSLVAYCPYGSHLPMLLRITTRRHLDRFEDLSVKELEELARLLRGTIRWMQAIYPDVAYNYLIHTRPPGIAGEEMAHWALEIFPRITQVAGFEWSSDCMINPVLPEVAAASYREVAIRENPFR